jgi:peptidoglycan/LPS O-acetylase OafA/YrhL
MGLPSLRARELPRAWRFALIGALASLPIAVLINWIPNSEATIGGSIMIVGAFIAGVIAANRSTDADAAGIRAGSLGGVVGVATFLVTVASDVLSGSSASWPVSRVVFFGFASVLFLFVAPIFGLVFGRVGGWVANTAVSLLGTGTTAS